jgi:hypothetical protein
MEGTRKGGRPQEKWTHEVEEDLKIMEIRNLHTVARDRKEQRRNVLRATVHNRPVSREKEKILAVKGTF